MTTDWVGGRSEPLKGEITVPGDKSVSHRALMLGAIAEGASRITGFLEGEDTRATARILAQLGVRIETPARGIRVVHGVGLHGLAGSTDPLDCGNAGTAMRLLAGLLCGQSFSSVLIGDESLNARPMARVTIPLARMGARIDARDGRYPPLIIHSNNIIQGIEYNTEIPSAQIKSAILLAGLYAKGETTVLESQPTRDYTERMLQAFGWPVDVREGRVSLSGGHRLSPVDTQVPSDFSSAAFFLVAATLVPGSDLVIRGVGMNPRRTGLLRALRMMGADIVESSPRVLGSESIADLRVRAAPLRGMEIPGSLIPDMVDEVPVLMVAAAAASGRTRISGAAELRVKESDRLSAMSQALGILGITVVECEDGAVVEGGNLRDGDVETRGDHRIAMSMAVAAQRASGLVRIRDCDNVDTSFPGFLALARECGFGLDVAGPAVPSRVL